MKQNSLMETANRIWRSRGWIIICDWYNQENIEYNKQKSQFKFTKIINIPFSSEEPKKIADIIIENVQDANNYNWSMYLLYFFLLNNIKIFY